MPETRSAMNVLIALASPLVLSASGIYAVCSCWRRRRRAARAEAVARVRAWRLELLALEDEVALAKDRNRVLRSRLQDPAWRPERKAVQDEAERIVQAVEVRLRDLYDPPSVSHL